LAGELLREAEKLVNMKIHPMTIIAGILIGYGVSLWVNKIFEHSLLDMPFLTPESWIITKLLK
jgi:hypothetical protein